MLGWLAAALILLVAIFVYLSSGSDLEGGRLAAAIGLGALALLYLFSLAGDYRNRSLQALRHVATWGLIFLGLIIAYSFRGELKTVFYRVAGEVLPPGHVIPVEPGTEGGKAVKIRSSGSGHFAAMSQVNGTSMRMLVDTGASTIVLKATDARRAGIDVEKLSFSIPVSTANGLAYAAPVRLRSVGIGDIVYDDIEALVAKPGSLNENLLGMTFLKRLRSYDVTGNFMTLRG